MTSYPRAERRARKKAAKAKRPDERKFLVWSHCTPDRGPLVFVPGYVLPSLANERLHWRTLATIKARQRDLGFRMAEAIRGVAESDGPPKTIMLRRVGIRLLDDDNLMSAFKHIRDGIAAAYGVSDAPDGPIVWRYTQETDKTPGIDARWSR